LGRAVSNVDAFIAVSRFSRDKHREMGFSAAAPVEVIPHFVPAPLPGAAGGSPHPRPYFLVVGRLEKMKGVQAAIEAFRSHRDDDLLIVGDGSYEATLRRLAAGLPHVHFLGRLPYSRLQALFRHATALIVPSVGYETFGIVILEAFVQRTPVIVHNLGALPEIVQQSGGGLVYSDATGLVDALRALRPDTALRRSLGERGYEAYRRYWTPEVHLRQYFGLIRDIAARKGRRLDVLEEEVLA
jgi:glycosyltransferase involved in cell wall biosynthesis